MNLKRPTNGREATMIDPFWPDQLFPQLFLGSIHFSKHKAITSSSLRYLYLLLGGLGSSPPSTLKLPLPLSKSGLATTHDQPRVSILSIRYRSIPTAYVSCITVRSADRKNTLTLICEHGHPTLPVAARCWPVFVSSAFVARLFSLFFLMYRKFPSFPQYPAPNHSPPSTPLTLKLSFPDLPSCPSWLTSDCWRSPTGCSFSSIYSSVGVVRGLVCIVASAGVLFVSHSPTSLFIVLIASYTPFSCFP